MKMIPNRTLRLLIHWSPLVAMPFLLNLRWNAMIAPNEEPKWFVFVFLGLVLALAGSCLAYQYCRQKTPNQSAYASGLTLPGLLFLLFFIGLSLGVADTVNLGEGINRLAFWCAGGVTVWATSWAARQEAGSYLPNLRHALAISSLLLCTHFWYGFFVDFRDPHFTRIQFSRIGHFNFTADVLMLLIPLLAWTLSTSKMIAAKLAVGLALATSFFMLVISGSLGGMGGLLAGALVAGGLGLSRWFALGKKPTRTTQQKKLTATLTVIVLLGVAGKWIYQETPEEYRDQIFLRGVWWGAPTEQGFSKATSRPPLAPLWIAITPYLGSRTPMWAATTGMVAERPWLGFGTGSYLCEYPGFSKRYDLFGDYETLGIKSKTNPHNILLQIASENGIPLTLLFAGLYVWLVVQVIRQAWHEPSVFWLCGVWALWAAGLDAQVNHVFFNPASLFMAAISFGLLYGRLPKPTSAMTFSLCPAWHTPITPVLASWAILAIASYPLRWVVSEYYVAEALRLESSQSPASKHQIQFMWETSQTWSPTNIQAIYGLAQFHSGFRRITQAETTLQEFLKLCPYHSAGLNFLATLQADSGRLDEAESTLLEVLRLEPDATSVRMNLDEVRKGKAARAPLTPKQP